MKMITTLPPVDEAARDLYDRDQDPNGIDHPWERQDNDTKERYRHIVRVVIAALNRTGVI